MSLCLPGKTNSIATSLQFNSLWVVRNAEVQVFGYNTECKCLAEYAIRDKESVPNVMEEVSTSTTVNPARNVKEDAGINVMVVGVQAVVQVIDELIHNYIE
jgi:hypothetical protein